MNQLATIIVDISSLLKAPIKASKSKMNNIQRIKAARDLFVSMISNMSEDSYKPVLRLLARRKQGHPRDMATKYGLAQAVQKYIRPHPMFFRQRGRAHLLLFLIK